MVRRQVEETGQGLIVKSNGPKSAELVIGASGAAITWRMWVAGSTGWQGRAKKAGAALRIGARAPPRWIPAVTNASAALSDPAGQSLSSSPARLEMRAAPHIL